MKQKICTPVIVAEIARRMPCYQQDAREVLEHFVDIIIDAVGKGQSVYFAPLGTFYPFWASRPRQDGTRNQMLRFRPSAKIKRRVADGCAEGRTPGTPHAPDTANPHVDEVD